MRKIIIVFLFQLCCLYNMNASPIGENGVVFRLKYRSELSEIPSVYKKVGLDPIVIPYDSFLSFKSENNESKMLDFVKKNNLAKIAFGKFFYRDNNGKMSMDEEFFRSYGVFVSRDQDKLNSSAKYYSLEDLTNLGWKSLSIFEFKIIDFHYYSTNNAVADIYFFFFLSDAIQWDEFFKCWINDDDGEYERKHKIELFERLDIPVLFQRKEHIEIQGQTAIINSVRECISKIYDILSDADPDGEKSGGNIVAIRPIRAKFWDKAKEISSFDTYDIIKRQQNNNGIVEEVSIGRVVAVDDRSYIEDIDQMHEFYQFKGLESAKRGMTLKKAGRYKKWSIGVSATSAFTYDYEKERAAFFGEFGNYSLNFHTDLCTSMNVNGNAAYLMLDIGLYSEGGALGLLGGLGFGYSFPLFRGFATMPYVEVMAGEFDAAFWDLPIGVAIGSRFILDFYPFQLFFVGQLGPSVESMIGLGAAIKL